MQLKNVNNTCYAQDFHCTDSMTYIAIDKVFDSINLPPAVSFAHLVFLAAM
jgi:hypothetical protein